MPESNVRLQVDIAKYATEAQFCFTGFFAFFATAIALFGVGMPLVENPIISVISLNVIVALMIISLCCSTACFCSYLYIMYQLEKLKNHL